MKLDELFFHKIMNGKQTFFMWSIKIEKFLYKYVKNKNIFKYLGVETVFIRGRPGVRNPSAGLSISDMGVCTVLLNVFQSYKNCS